MPERCPECNLLGGHLPECKLAAASGEPPGPYRHGCLTAWLVWTIVACAVNAVITPFAVKSSPSAPGITPAMIALITALSVLGVVFNVAILKWKRWGVYGVMAGSAVAFLVNLSAGLGVPVSLIGLLGIVTLLVLLNIGGKEKAWRRLE